KGDIRIEFDILDCLYFAKRRFVDTEVLGQQTGIVVAGFHLKQTNPLLTHHPLYSHEISAAACIVSACTIHNRPVTLMKTDQAAEFVSYGGLPQTHSAIAARGQHIPIPQNEDSRVDSIFMTFKPADLLAGGGLPQPRCMIETGRQHIQSKRR